MVADADILEACYVSRTSTLADIYSRLPATIGGVLLDSDAIREALDALVADGRLIESTTRPGGTIRCWRRPSGLERARV